jgi:hypothetical protein
MDDTAHALAHQHKAAAETKLGVSFAKFNPIGYSTQVRTIFHLRFCDHVIFPRSGLRDPCHALDL